MINLKPVEQIPNSQKKKKKKVALSSCVENHSGLLNSKHCGPHGINALELSFFFSFDITLIHQSSVTLSVTSLSVSLFSTLVF